MTVQVSYSIMAHPSRRNLVARLAPRLGNPPIAWDRIGDRWDTGKRALELAHPSSDYCAVIQDDAILPNGFGVAVRNALANIPPDSPLVLYATRTRQWAPVLDRVPRDASYLVMDRIWWGVGLVIPTATIPELVDFCEAGSNPHYDHRLGSFFETVGIPVFYSWPNLCDHRHVPSLIPGRSAHRSAHNFVRGRADRLRWDGPTVRVEPPAAIKVPVL